MSNISHRQQKIQEKRKQTSWRDFLLEIGSWKPLTFHKINGKLSVYAPNARVHKITDPEEFEEMRDNLPSNEFTDNFMEGFQNLRDKIPLPGRLHFGLLENAAFTTTSTRAKNNYLTYNISNVEDIAYTVSVKAHSKNVCNSVMVYDHCDTIYFSYGIFNGFNIFYSRYIHNSRDIWFSSNCINCKECLFCSDLENQSYCIRNKQYEKEDYFSQKKGILKQKEEFIKGLSEVDRQGSNFGSKNCDGSCVIKSTDTSQSHSIYNITNGKNVYMSGEEKDNQYMYDVMFAGALGGNHYYGVVDIAGCEHIYCSTLILGCANIYYSYFLQNCSYCLGCIGLKNKSFCIFNKQYEKKEREEKASQLFSNMDDSGILGDFLSKDMCPYYFNDSIAFQLDDSFTKEEVTAKGYLRRDEQVKVDIPEGMEVVKTSELGEYEGWRVGEDDNSSVRYIDPSILDKVIQDEDGNIYRIVKMEYDFLMKHGLPLPRLHRLERLKMNFRMN